MSSKTEARAGFQWNVGAWFGTQIGSTAWIAILGFILIGKDPHIAALIFLLFLTPNIVGTSLWMGRSRIGAYPAIQILLFVAWVCAMGSIYVIEASGLWASVSGIDIDGHGTGTVSTTSMKLLIALMFPLIMALFFLMQCRMRD